MTAKTPAILFLCMFALVVPCIGALPAQAQEARAAKNGITAADQVRSMGRGVNILGYDGYLDGHTTKFNLSLLKKIHDAGFDTVRINMFFSSHFDKNGKIDPDWLNKLDTVVATALQNNLTVVLDAHGYTSCSDAPDACIIHLKRGWKQLAEHYRHAPVQVIFELMNEPQDAIDAALWNRWIPQLLASIRPSNPRRNVVIGPAHSNNPDNLPLLELPENDRHIIVTYHYYSPLEFTHQGASWTKPEIKALKNIHFGTLEEIRAIDRDFDKVSFWAREHRRPIFLGEFGALESGAMPERVLWTSTVARSAEKHGFAFAYWQFDCNFVVYDMDRQDWVKPILEALIPPQK